MSVLSAAYGGDVAFLRATPAVGLRCSDSHGRTPLHYAALANQVECVRLMLDVLGEKSTLDKDESGNNILHAAAGAGALQVATLLLEGEKEKEKERGATGATGVVVVDDRDSNGRSPLHLACGAGQEALVALLLKHSADVLATDAEGRFPLHYAAQAGSASIVELLLARDPGAMARSDHAGILPLHVACLCPSLTCVDILLAASGAPSAADVFVDATGATPLHYAAAGGSEEVVSLLLDRGGNPLAIDSSGSTPLHFAVRNGHEGVCVMLSKATAETGVAVPNIAGDLPVHLAAFHGHLNLLQLMENSFPKIVEGLDSLIHKAAFSGHANCLEYLLKRADMKIDSLGSQQATALHKAARGGSLACVKMLVDAGASIWALDEQKSLPFHKACHGGHCDVASFLYALMVKEKKDLRPETLLDDRKNSPLHMAAGSGSAACLEFCLSHFKDSESDDGFWCAHYAAMRGDAAVLEVIHKADAAMLDRLTRDGRNVREIASDNRPFLQALSRLQSNTNAAFVVPHSPGMSGPVPGVAGPVPPPRNLPNDMLNRAVALFNAKPAKGLEFVVQQKLVASDDPDVIAKFLFETEALSKKKIGELITESDDRSQALANAFLRQLDFKGKDFDASIRLFLSKFMLPGEAQKIDRVMEMFASRFHEQNPDSFFKNADTCYVLAFAVIMLNTDLFNPSIKKEKKMTRDQWRNHVRGINDGEDLPLDFVLETYDKIRNNEIKMESETNMFANAGKKGFCMKQGGKIRTWKKRFFILSDHQLFYFKTVQDESPIGIIPLENLTVEKEEKAVKHGFRISSTDGSIIKSVRMSNGGAPKKGNHTFYIMGAASAEEQTEWIDALNQAIHRSPFYNLLLAKKKV